MGLKNIVSYGSGMLLLSEKDIYYFLLWKYDIVMKSKRIFIECDHHKENFNSPLKIYYLSMLRSQPTSMSLYINSNKEDSRKRWEERWRRGGRDSL